MNKVTSIFKLSIFSFVVFSSTAIFAQTKDRDKLEETEQVNVVQDYKPTIADANKINDNPEIKDTFKINNKLTYSFIEKQALTKFEISPISAANTKGDILNKLYNNYFRAGLGNYNTPLAEGYFTTTRSKTQQMGIHAKHFSSTSTNSNFPSFSDNIVNGFGKFFVKDHNIYADVDYNRNAMHYYGYDSNINYVVAPKPEKQVYNYIGAKTYFESTYSDSNKINYNGTLNYYYLQAAFSSKEQNVFAQVGGTKKINSELYGANLSYDFYHNSRIVSAGNAGILKINPFAKAQTKKWNAKIGLNLIAETDIGKVHFYPDIDFTYRIIQEYMAGYALLNGNTERNSYKKLSDINPFILPFLDIKNTNTALHFNAGLRGKINAKFSYDAGFDYKRTKDLALFVNSLYEDYIDYSNIYQNRTFITVYDDVNIANVYGLLAYQAAEKLFIYSKGNVYQYKTTKEIKAWHKPNYDFTLGARYSLKEKIIVKADVFFIGNQFAKDESWDSGFHYVGTKELKGITDINIGVEYRYTKRISAFVNFNNLAAMLYQRWNNYPTYRFNLLGGLTFCF